MKINSKDNVINKEEYKKAKKQYFKERFESRKKLNKEEKEKIKKGIDKKNLKEEYEKIKNDSVEEKNKDLDKIYRILLDTINKAKEDIVDYDLQESFINLYKGVIYQISLDKDVKEEWLLKFKVGLRRLKHEYFKNLKIYYNPRKSELSQAFKNPDTYYMYEFEILESYLDIFKNIKRKFRRLF